MMTPLCGVVLMRSTLLVGCSLASADAQPDNHPFPISHVHPLTHGAAVRPIRCIAVLWVPLKAEAFGMKYR
eukprot:151209-Pleurochrysis_carterae.AAC.1